MAVETQPGARRRALVPAAVLLVLVLAAGAVVWRARAASPALVITHTPTTAAPATTAVIPQPDPVLAQPPPPVPIAAGAAVGLQLATGRPHRPAIAFTSTIDLPDHLVFVLVLGSDARPGEDVLRTRADSIHLIAANPVTRQGTVVGIPRDSYVEYPNGRRGKINDALARGGPSFAAGTVQRMSGLPVDYVVTTGFVGFQKMVDEVGGVDVFVERRMDDRMSGARFSPGWHHFVGGEALAYSRNRTDVPNGDFSRSENQGRLLLAGLSKLRSEVADDPSLLRWASVLARWAEVDVPPDHLPRLAALARRIDPERMTNVVLPGRIGYAGKASVVYLTEDAPRLFEDLRDDAVIGTAAPEPVHPGDGATAENAGPAAAPSTTSTTSTSLPAAPPGL